MSKDHDVFRTEIGMAATVQNHNSILQTGADTFKDFVYSNFLLNL